jgi:hypothetical protein
VKTLQYLSLTIILVPFSLATFIRWLCCSRTGSRSRTGPLFPFWTDEWLKIFAPDCFYNITLYLNFTSDRPLFVADDPYNQDYGASIKSNNTENYSDFEIQVHDWTLHVTVNPTTGIYVITLYASYLELTITYLDNDHSKPATYANGTYQIRVHNAIS